MKYLIIILVCFTQIGKTQTFSYPLLSKQGKDITTLVPSRWNAIDTAFGDLNNDKLEDLVIILEYNLPISENRAYGDNETDLIKEFQKPRVLAIYFKNAQNGKYTLALQNNNFILRANEGGSLGDPLKNISTANNKLVLEFEGGANWRWKLNYEFKYQNKDWNLVKANNIYYNALSGEMTNRQYNFLARRMRLISGNLADQEGNSLINEETLIFTNFKTFATFKKPWTWEITKDNFL
ncbi:hypothetical protein FA048_10395 [Pedobacter polaris]|uniref:Uncharacterized protein n=1 Tax=Pedobacter polaris TaxID=2571273 RepID=A0A4U1CRA1_9SPHI|nr:hypothetical protein [Pedobacter polaris]TKC10581.1 hypothetical protein FA048_10395 [Pedobacter polaris]